MKKTNKLNDYGLDLFNQIDNLPKLHTEISSEQQSSYSRDGGNADGFGITNHAGPNRSGEPLDNDDPNHRVLLNLKQPGVIYRMWFTTWDLTAPRIKIYIDGETTPSYNFNFDELSSGTYEPFTGSLVFDQQTSSGGVVSYLPIVFKRSIKVIGSGYFYYNINYQKYPQGTVLNYDDYQTKLPSVNDMMANVGSNPKNVADDLVDIKNISLKANESKTIFELSDKQTVTALNINFNDFKVRKFVRDEHEETGINITDAKQISYLVNVKPNVENKLVFKGVLMNKPQTASLQVDDLKTKLNFRARRIDGFEWRDSEYFYDQTVILPITDKSKINISIGSGVELYSMKVVSGDNQIDIVNFGNPESRNKHKLIGDFETITKTLEYDPNHLIDSSTWEEIYHDEDIINQVYLKISYPDKKEAVNAPVSSFFGFGAYGLFETLSLMVGLKEDGTMYSYYPMPFEAGIKIELVNKSNHDFNNIFTSISHKKNLLNKDEYGYFKAHYVKNIHNTSTALKTGEPITFITTGGQGLIVGVTHSMSAAYIGEHSRFYLEGDEQIYIDGSMSHSLHGTGTEDFYNGGWYFKTGVQTNPLFGQSNHNYRDNRDRTVMLRTLISDPIYFRNHIDFKMEHGGWNESEQADVFGLVYYYHQEQPSIIQTDEFNLSKQDDIERVNYKPGIDSHKKVMPNGAKYEGYYNGLKTPFTIYYELHTHTDFTVQIDPNNKGVIIRREYLMKHIGQQAIVYVDENKVGVWHSSFRNAFDNYVRQDEFFIPKEFTENKQSIHIKIEVVPNHESLVWTESMYQIFSIIN